MSIINIEKSRMKKFKSLCTTYALKEDYLDLLSKDLKDYDFFSFIVNVDSKRETQAKKFL